MLTLTIGLAIGSILMVLEYFLCTRLKNPLWGGIIPLVVLFVSVYLFASGTLPLERRYLSPFIFINLLYLGDWDTGRKKYKQKQVEELEKMKVMDM